MAIDVKNLIAAINPDVYCDNTPDYYSGKRLVDQVKKVVKEKGYLEAAKIARIRKSLYYIDNYHILLTKGAFAMEGIKNPIEQQSNSSHL